MFGNNQIEKINERFSDLEVSERNFSQRIKLIEKQLEPKPSFKKGDIVNFFLIDNEFVGEIVEQEREYSYRYFFSNPSEREATGRWLVRYLDANNVSQEVAVKEEDIWVDDGCQMCELHDQIEELSFRIKAIENKKE